MECLSWQGRVLLLILVRGGGGGGGAGKVQQQIARGCFSDFVRSRRAWLKNIYNWHMGNDALIVETLNILQNFYHSRE